jgi:hypothetical protein
MAKLELSILAGEESKKFLMGLEEVVDRLERVARVLRSPEENEEAGVTSSDEDDEEEKPAKKKAATKKKADSFEDGDEEDAQDSEDEEAEKEDDEAEEDEDDAEEEEPATKKKKKADKITSDDLNDAAKARAARTSVAETKAFIKKKLGVKSISEIEEEDYEMALKVLKGK